MKIGQKLKGMRIEKGFSTIVVAEKLNISESTYRRYESDKGFPDVFTLDKIAKLYDKNFTDLLPKGISIINNHEYLNNAGYVANQYLSEKLVKQYEEKIKELKEQVEFWRNKSEENK